MSYDKFTALKEIVGAIEAGDITLEEIKGLISKKGPEEKLSDYVYETSEGIRLGDVGDNIIIRVVHKERGRVAAGNILELDNAGTISNICNFLSLRSSPKILTGFFKRDENARVKVVNI